MIDNVGAQPCTIGTGPGELNVRNVFLLGLIFVSDGAAMPLLAVRQEQT